MSTRPPAALALALSLLIAACSGNGGTRKPDDNGGEGGSDSGGSGGGGSTGGRGGSGTGGRAGSGGSGGSSMGGMGEEGGSGGATGGSGGGGAVDAGTSADGAAPKDAATVKDVSGGNLPRFSFFLTSLVAMRRLSKSQNGFGGDLRYGTADGLTGADKICTEIAESSMPGAGAKEWHAFLSAAKGPDGTPVNAIDRIGEGPWYDRMGRVLAMTKADLLFPRPRGADPVIVNDLPNELGIPNHRPDPSQPAVDNHHFLTGSDAMGRLYGANATCNSWTALTNAGRPRIGFSWPEGGRTNWLSGQDEGGCGAGVNLAQTGGSDPGNPIVGSGGGYGGIYCFAKVP